MILSQGAEAVLIQEGDVVIKQRVPKSYRHESIDKRLRTSRTKREVKVLQKLADVLPVPKVYSSDATEFHMEFIAGPRLRDYVVNYPTTSLFKEIGVHVAKLHDLGIIHGDLTTSNILVKDHKPYFIDFGLSFFSSKIEDMAVDLHVLEEALESTHYQHAKDYFASFLEGYSSCSVADEVLSRLKIVHQRGRNK